MDKFNAVYSILVPILSAGLTIATFLIWLGGKNQQFKTLLEDVKELKTKFDNMSKDVERIKTQIEICLPIKPFGKANALAQSNSPISLTEKGLKVKEALKADVMLQNHKQELEKFLDNSKLNNAYDIQSEAFKVIIGHLLEVLNPQELLTLKNTAFQMGQPLADLFIIYQVIFRDMLLKDKNIPISDVDKFDPNKKHD